MSISEVIEQLEQYRGKINFCNKMIMISGVTVFLSQVIFGILEKQSLAVLMVYVTIAVSIAFSARSQMINKKCKMLYKTYFVKGILEEHFENVVYDWNRGFSELQVRNMALPRMGNRFSSEDYVSATYNGVHFEQSDAVVKYKSGGKHSTTRTNFKGRIFVFHIKPKCFSDIRVCSANFLRDFTPDLDGAREEIHMEDAQFDNDFEVLATNAHDAFYILTPVMMERIRLLEQTYGNIAIRFNRDRVFVAYNSNDNAFDLKIRKEVNYYDLVQDIKSDIMEIIDIIDVLKIESENNN